MRRIAAAGQRNVEDVVIDPGFRTGAGSGIKRRLMRGGVKQLGPIEESGLRAITVMHVEVDDCDTVELMHFMRIGSRARSLIKNAKTHRPVRLRMMAAWAGRTKNVARFLVHYRIDAGTGRTHAAHYRLPRSRRPHRVAAVQHDIAVFRGGIPDIVDESFVVNQQHLLAYAERGFSPLQG